MIVRRRPRQGSVLLMVAALILGPFSSHASVSADPSASTLPTESVAAGAVSLAVRPDGSVWGWGLNWQATLGDGTTASTYKPSRLTDLQNVNAVTTGTFHALALKDDGTVLAWGYNNEGQLGDGAQGDTFGQVLAPNRVRKEPLQVAGLSNVQQVVAAENFSLALKADGTVWAWGSNFGYALGIGSGPARSRPDQVPGLPPINSLAAGKDQVLAVATDGSVWHWGLMDSTIYTPHQLPALTGAMAVAVGDSFAMALKTDGTVWTWGQDQYGQLGNGSDGASNVPVQVADLAHVTRIAAGSDFALAVKADGSLWAWGRNDDGQLGNGTKTDGQIPMAVAGLSNVVAVDGGLYYALAMTADGQLWTWGYGSGIGDGTDSPQRSTPYHVPLPLDTAAPTWPAGSSSQVVGYASNVATVSWTPASDPDGIYRYRLFVDGLPAATVAGTKTTAQVKGFDAGKTHTVTVKAQDAAGNWSAVGPSVSGRSGYGLLAAGGDSSLALQPDGTILAWGSNGDGLLGDGTRFDADLPTRTHIIDDAVQVTTSGKRTQALRSDGTVWEWGAATGSGSPVTEPMQVAGLADVVSVSSGGNSLAVKAEGTVWSWYTTGAPEGVQRAAGFTTRVISVTGNNYRYLALDQDGALWNWNPGEISMVTEGVSMASGEGYSLVLRSDGTVWSWGKNDRGQLGDGTNIDRPTLDQVSGLTGVTMVAAGAYHALALKSDGTVWAWGLNGYGQLGDGTTTDQPTPVQVTGLSDVVSIAAGAFHSLAMTADGAVWAWGANDKGQLGDGTREVRPTPVAVAAFAPDNQPPLWPSGSELSFSNVGPVSLTVTWPEATDNAKIAAYRVYRDDVQIAETISRTLTLPDLYAGRAYRFGVSAADGQGNWSPKLEKTVTTGVLAPETLVDSVSAHEFSFFARTESGVWTWGPDPGWSQGSANVTHDLPIRPEPSDLVALSTGFNHTLGLRADGTVWAWGTNDRGQLGNGTAGDGLTWLPPSPVEGLTHVKQVAANGQHSVVLKEDGTVWAWGAGDDGQLGDGTGKDRLRPVLVPGLTNVVAIASGSDHTVALESDGTVWAWGFNYSGQLGDGTSTNRLLPIKATSLNDVTAIAAGESHTLALRADGTVWGWGGNYDGQLGPQPWSCCLRPAAIGSLTGVTAIAAGSGHSLAIREDGTLWAWGKNDRGQLGIRSYYSQTIPQVIPGFVARAVAASATQSIAIRDDGTAWAWGDGASRPAYVLMPPRDTEAPSWQGKGVSAVTIESTAVELRWATPQDPGGVPFYRLYQDGALIGTVSGGTTGFIAKGLKPSTTYRFQVQGRDAWGNWSTNGPMIDVKMSAPDKEAPRLSTAEDGKPGLWLGMELDGEVLWTRPKTATADALNYVFRPATSYRFYGEMTEPIDRVVVNGQAVDAEFADSTFAFATPIKAGSSVMTIEVYDLAGNKAVLPKVKLQPDTSAPKLTITAPKLSTAQANESATMTGTVSEELLGLLVWSAEAQEFLRLTSMKLEGKNFTVTVELPNTHEGESNHLRVIGVDYALNVSQPDALGADARTYVIDTTPPDPPVVTSPTFTGGALATTQRSLTVKGRTVPTTIVKTSLGTEENWGTPVLATVDAKGAFTVTLPLPEGASTLRVWAEDSAGNRSVPAVYTVTRDTTGPTTDSMGLQVRRGSTWSTLPATLTPKRGYSFSLMGADAYALEGSFSEPLGAVTVGGKSTGVTLSESQFTADLTNIKNGSNSIQVVVKDVAGNATQIAVTINIDMTRPSLTVTQPTGNLLIGAGVNQAQVLEEFSGTASELLQALRVLDTATGQELALESTVQIDTRDPKRWRAQILFPTDSLAQWSLRFEGQDLAGNWSTAESRGKDQRLVTVDPVAPVLTLLKDLPDVIYTNGNDGWVSKGKLTIAGTVSDADSGIKQIQVGTTTLKPTKGKEHQFDFTTGISLTDGKVTTIDLYAVDNAGNRSPMKTIRLLYRSKISKLSVRGTWSSATQTLLITGATDAAFTVGAEYLAVLPLTITLTDSQRAVVQTFSLDTGSMGGYDLDRGSFTLSLKNPMNLPTGTYTITVTALAPPEMPWLAPKSATSTVTVRR
jgi:alpha-tubulin suppressor-like RCC1 family protein